MNSALLLRRLVLASAAASAACGARTGDDLSEPAELLTSESVGRAGAGGAAAGSSGTGGMVAGGKGGSVAGGSGGAAAKVVTGCFDDASCVPNSWCNPKNSAGTVCACDSTGKQSCGKSVPFGEPTLVCLELPTPDLPCPQAQDPSLYQTLPWELGCSGVTAGPVFYSVGEHPTCCYTVGNFGCGGRPFVVSELGWTSRLVSRTDWS